MHPNQFVAEQLGGLPPGRALDLAAGEGRNSVWLAERGWSVTAVDFSRVGLEKGRKLSAAHGVPDGQVDWVVADLGEFRPTFILAVPRVFEKVYNSALSKAEDGGKGGIFHKAAEIVRNGLIGTVTHVEVGLPGENSNYDHIREETAAKLAAAGLTGELEQIVPGTKAWDLLVCAPPAELDYETWVGPARMEPYIKARSHKCWRLNYNTGSGKLLDWIGHHGDIAHWGLDFDNTGPLEVEGTGELPPANAVWNTAQHYRFELKYPEGVTMTVAGGHPDIKMGTKWIGTEGWVWVDRDGFDVSNPAWKRGKYLPRELRKVKLYTSDNHHQNFLDCIKTRQPTVTPVEVGHHSTIPGHLCLISMLTGRKIRWNAKEEKILGDEEAGKLMTREYRAPWKMSI